MKRLLICLFSIICLTACNLENCPRCGKYVCVCKQSYSGNNDYFSVSTLVGEWQMSGYNDKAYMNGCGIIPKDIIFAKVLVGGFGKCTITYSIDRDPQWYQMDLYYNFVRRELTFYGVNEYGELEKLYAFTYNSFLYPTLVVQDSFGKYEWRKIRVTTPT